MNLEKYGVELVENPVGIPLKDLENESELVTIVEEYAKYLETDSLAVAGSLFLKRYAVLIAASSLDYYEFQDKKLEWFSHARFEKKKFKIYLPKSEPTKIMDNWQERIIAIHLQKMIHIISVRCKVNKNILWENIAVRLNAVIQKKQKSYSISKIKSIVEDLTDSNASWFRGEKNALSSYCHLNKMKRKTCCKYYLLENKEEGMPYCLVCPLKKE